MQRLCGLFLTIFGAVAVLWGGFHMLSGQSAARITVTDSVSISAMLAGLIGVLVFTLGLIWVRD